MSTQQSSSTSRIRPRLKELAKVDLIEVLDVADEVGAKVVGESIHWRREYYLPLRHGELRQRLATDERLTAEEKQQFLQFCKILAAIFHYEYHERVEQLKGEYEPFDPDAARSGMTNSAAVTEEQARNIGLFIDRMTDLLRRANYHRLTQSQIEQAIAAASDWGVKLDVDFGVFDRLEVFARGDVVGRRTRHRWQNFFRPEEVDVPIYQRVTVIFQLKPGRRTDKHLDASAVYIKLFKNIPKEDVDMMLPGTKTKFSLADSGRILLPTISGLAIIVWKLILGTLFVAAMGVVGFVVLIAGLVGYGLRSLFGYWNTQTKYQLNLTKNLYLQNLDNSSGVLLRLTDEAEEQEFHEAVMAYFLLWREAGETGWTKEELDRTAEAYLQKVCGHGVDFEVDDAVQKLQRLGLAKRTATGSWQAVELAEALRALDKTWDDFFRHA